MSVPCPIVRCENVAVRNKLRADLFAMGFCKRCGTTFPRLIEMFGDDQYVTLIGNGCQTSEDSLPGDMSHLTLVNSPAHMLSYIKRHNLAPRP